MTRARFVAIILVAAVAGTVVPGCLFDMLNPCGKSPCGSGPDLVYVRNQDHGMLDLADLAEQITDDPPTLVVTVTNLATGYSVTGSVELNGTVERGFDIHGDEDLDEIQFPETANIGSADSCTFASRITLDLQVPSSWDVDAATLFPSITWDVEADIGSEREIVAWDRWRIEYGWYGWIC
jgi:hypothetical protein